MVLSSSSKKIGCLASRLFHEDIDNPIRSFIYEKTTGTHPKDVIPCIEPHTKEIRALLCQYLYRRTYKQWDALAKKCTLGLRKKIILSIKGNPIHKEISIDMSYLDMQQIDCIEGNKFSSRPTI